MATTNNNTVDEALTKTGLAKLWEIIKAYFSSNSLSTASPTNKSPVGEGNPDNLD